MKLVWTREDDIDRLLPPARPPHRQGHPGQGRLSGHLAPPAGHPVDHEGLAHGRAEAGRDRGRGDQGLALPQGHPDRGRPAAACPNSPVPVLWWRSVGATHTRRRHGAHHRPAGHARPARTRSSTAAPSTPRPAPSGTWPSLNLAAEKAGWAGPSAGGWSPRRGGARVLRFGGGPDRGREAGRTAVSQGRARWSPPSTAAPPSRPTRSPPRWKAAPATACRRPCSAQVTLKDGAVEQTNFDTYRVLRNHRGAAGRDLHRARPAHRPRAGWASRAPRSSPPAVANALPGADRQGDHAQLPLVKA